VTEDKPPHYRAFLSYAHADKAAADWLFHAMEAFQIGKDLIGQVTERGAIPDRLYPVFKDRNEFSPGGDLAEETLKALRESAALIVLCSPRSAASTNVQREIAMFRDLYGDSRPIIPLILGGEPGQTVAAWFPPPLTPDRLAADWREDVGDGRDLALAKVIAALLGLPPEQVYRRLERERRRVFWRQVKWAAVIVLLAVVAGYAGWMWWTKHGKLEEQTRVVEAKTREVAETTRSLEELQTLALNYIRLTNPAAAADARSVDDLMQTLRRIDQEAAAGDTRKAEVLRRIAAGDAAGALALQEEIARDAKVAIGRDRTALAEKSRKAAEEYRTVARLADYGDPKRAREAYAEALRLDPDDVGSWMQVAYLQFQAGALAEAETAYRRALTLGRPGQHDRDLYWSRLGLGDILVARGDLSGAMGEYADARVIAERLARADPANAGWQRDLSVSFNKVGDVLRAQGKGEEALSNYRDSLAIAERLARADPANAGWQRDRSVSFQKVGDVLVAQGKGEEALTAYRDNLAIRERLARADPANAGLQWDLLVSFGKVGDVLVAQGGGEEALSVYYDSLAIAERLALADPGNAGWQFDLGISHERIGNVLLAQGQSDEALRAYRARHAIIQGLARSDPANASWQRDLSVAFEKVGDMLVAQGKGEEALAAYRDSLAIRERLARSDPANAGWQRDLAVSQFKLGVFALRSGDVAEARRLLTTGRAIVAGLAARSPDWAVVRRDVEWVDRVLGSIPP